MEAPVGKTKPSLESRRIAFCRELAEVKARAGELGLFRTMHKLDLATVEVGYEVAGEDTPKERHHARG